MLRDRTAKATKIPVATSSKGNVMLFIRLKML
jgi:hypothetical protein